MDRPVLVDTDVMVDFLRGHPKAIACVSDCSARIALSTIVVAELYAGVKGKDEMQTLDNLVSLFRIVPVSREIARAGGIYRQTYARSHGVGLADAIIAAAAESLHAELRTLNTKHFPMFKNLRPAYNRAPDQ